MQELRYVILDKMTYFVDCTRAIPGTFMDINIRINMLKRSSVIKQEI